MQRQMQTVLLALSFSGCSSRSWPVFIFVCNTYVIFAGTQFTQQSYKVSESFPFKWISKKWKEGFHVTSMATAGSRWAVVMSRNSGFNDQVVCPPFNNHIRI